MLSPVFVTSIFFFFFMGLIYREKTNGTKTHWNSAKSLQKPYRGKDNRQGSSGFDFLIGISLDGIFK